MTAIDFADLLSECLLESEGAAGAAAAPLPRAERRFAEAWGTGATQEGGGTAGTTTTPPPLPHPDCSLVPDFVTAAEADALKDVIYSEEGAEGRPWHNLRNRRLQNLGGYPHPQGCLAEALPGWAAQVCRRVERCGLWDAGGLNQVLLNEYVAGQGIAAHKDGDELYSTAAAILSLEAEAEIVLTPDDPEGGEALRIALPPNSLFIFRGALFSRYTHCVPCRSGPAAPPLRLSLTMRHALLPCEVGGRDLFPGTPEGRCEMERRKKAWIRAVTDVPGRK